MGRPRRGPKRKSESWRQWVPCKVTKQIVKKKLGTRFHLLAVCPGSGFQSAKEPWCAASWLQGKAKSGVDSSETVSTSCSMSASISGARRKSASKERSASSGPLFSIKEVYFSMMSKPGFTSLHGYTSSQYFASLLYSLLIKTNLVLSICIFFVLDSPFAARQHKAVFEFSFV